MTTKAEAVATMRKYIKTYLDILSGGKALTAKQSKALETDLKTLDKDLAAFADDAPAAASATVDLTTPDHDTAKLLRQWIAVHDGATAPAGSVFANPGEAENQIVQLTADIVSHGSKYWPVGSVTPAILALAQGLNAGNKFALTPPFADALASGNPNDAGSQTCVGPEAS